MFLTFYGATREVTGSMHLLTSGDDRILLDCGLYQGRRREVNLKNRVLPFDPGIITNTILSHAHMDHSGRIPLITKKGFTGRVFCTRATADACQHLLSDSASIQESDANYINYKTARSSFGQKQAKSKGKRTTKNERTDISKMFKKNKRKPDKEAINHYLKQNNLKTVRPLYTMEDARESLTHFDGRPYGRQVPIGRDMTCTLYDAGHILGSAFTVIRSTADKRKKTIFYTGDIGRFDKPIIEDPTLVFDEQDREIDLLVMESTYGNRLHEPMEDIKDGLKEALAETMARNGSLVIPSFAFGRTQELLYVLHEIYNEGFSPRVPIYVDSPLATNITRVYGEHPEVYDAETHANFLEKGQNPFSFEQVHFVKSVEESMSLMREKKPHIIIASSGMCEAGRILHHLRHKIHNPNNTILIVGFMAQNTLGRRIFEQGTEFEKNRENDHFPVMKILNKEYPLKAHVVKLGGFSAHGDKKEMLRFIKESNLNVKRIALVHGEEEQSLAFANYLKDQGFSAFVPSAGESIRIE